MESVKNLLGISTERNILAFGDSLTKGYHSRGYAHHPYSNKLKELIQKSCKKTYKIDNAGVNGDTTENMIRRLKEILSKKKYEYIIILGGTNNLGDSSSTQIFDNLKALHNLVLEKGGQSFAITIPENEQENKFPKARDTRLEANELLKAFASEKSIPVIDLATKLPYHSLSEEDRKKYWDDSLHLKPAGYDRFAEIVFETLKGFTS